MSPSTTSGSIHPCQVNTIKDAFRKIEIQHFPKMPTPQYMIDKTNDKKYRLNGYKPSARLPKKENLRRQFRDVMQFKSEDELPKGGVDLRDMMPPVQCQSKIASW